MSYIHEQSGDLVVGNTHLFRGNQAPVDNRPSNAEVKAHKAKQAQMAEAKERFEREQADHYAPAFSFELGEESTPSGSDRAANPRRRFGSILGHFKRQ